MRNVLDPTTGRKRRTTHQSGQSSMTRYLFQKVRSSTRMEDSESPFFFSFLFFFPLCWRRSLPLPSHTSQTGYQNTQTKENSAVITSHNDPDGNLKDLQDSGA